MKLTYAAIKARCQPIIFFWQERLTHQQRITSIIIGSLLLCVVLLCCFRASDEPVMYSMQPHGTATLKAPIKDTATQDTPEESLKVVAIEYSKVIEKVDAITEQQRHYQDKMEKMVQALQEEVKTLKATLKAVQAEQAALKAASHQIVVSNASQKSTTPSSAQTGSLVDVKAVAHQSARLLAKAKAALTAHPKAAARLSDTKSAANTPLTFVNDLSLRAGNQKPLPALPATALKKSPLPHQSPRKVNSTETIQNDWPNVSDTAHNRAQAKNKLQAAFDRLSGEPTNKTTPAAHVTDGASNDSIPYYTLPANATGLQAKLMTALVGRIPVHGHVQDPYPFKIILGPENLAANGLKVPEVSGMIVAGFAVGDMTLRSVKGWITSVTFVFPDGRIHTVQAAAQGSSLPTQAGSLGYLSDPYGNPFLPGKLITNAPTEMATALALGSAQGLAGAFAHQSLPVNLPSGNKAALLMPAPKHFSRWLAGHTATEATTQVNNWWKARHSGSFDAIYVPAGKPVVINFTREIAIDYHKNGRKLNYANTKIVLPTVSTAHLSLSPDAGGLD